MILIEIIKPVSDNTNNGILTKKLYYTFKGVRISKSLSSLSSSFTLETTPIDLNSQNFTIKRGDLIKIYSSGQYYDKNGSLTAGKDNLMLKGYISRIQTSYDLNQHNVIISGYNRLQDLVISSIKSEGASDRFKNIKTYQKLVESVLSTINMSFIKVENKVKTVNEKTGEFTDVIDELSLTEIGDDILTPSREEKCYEFLERIGVKKNVFLKCNNNGNIDIIRGYDGMMDMSLFCFSSDKGSVKTNKNNILSATYSTNDEDIYNTYVVRTNINPSSKDINKILLDIENSLQKPDNTDVTTELKHTEIDDTVRNTKYIELITNEQTKEKLIERSIYEKNKRNSSSEVYSVVVQGHVCNVGKNNEQLFDIGKLIKVKDEMCGVDGTYLIKDIDFEYDIMTGSKTILNLVHKDSFKLFDITKKKKKGNVIKTLIRQIDEGKYKGVSTYTSSDSWNDISDRDEDEDNYDE